MTNLSDPAARQRTDTHDMLIVHRVFRREFTLIPRLVRQVAAGDTDRAAVVAGHARLVLAGLHMHHTGEDELLWPKLLERAQPSSELIHRMEAQHEGVEGLTAQVTEALDRWEAEARPAVAQEVADTFDAFRVALLEHLDDEETYLLPIAAEHLSQAEWNQLGEGGADKVDKKMLPILFGSILEECDARERRRMMANLPVPVRVLLRTVGAWQYRRYITRVRQAA